MERVKDQLALMGTVATTPNRVPHLALRTRWGTRFARYSILCITIIFYLSCDNSPPHMVYISANLPKGENGFMLGMTEKLFLEKFPNSVRERQDYGPNKLDQYRINVFQKDATASFSFIYPDESKRNDKILRACIISYVGDHINRSKYLTMVDEYTKMWGVPNHYEEYGTEYYYWESPDVTIELGWSNQSIIIKRYHLNQQ